MEITISKYNIQQIVGTETKSSRTIACICMISRMCMCINVV